MNSHRSEIFGLLSAVLFIDEYYRYYGFQMNSELCYYCDNQEVIRKLVETKKNK